MRLLALARSYCRCETRCNADCRDGAVANELAPGQFPCRHDEDLPMLKASHKMNLHFEGVCSMRRQMNIERIQSRHARLQPFSDERVRRIYTGALSAPVLASCLRTRGVASGAAVFPWQGMDESLVREARLKPAPARGIAYPIPPAKAGG